MISKSSSKYLSDSDIKNLSQDQIQRAINEIYARNGHIFTTAKWKDYFKKYSWYSPRQTVTDAQFNKYERANVKKLASKRK